MTETRHDSEPHELREFPCPMPVGWRVAPARILLRVQFSDHREELPVRRIGVSELQVEMPAAAARRLEATTTMRLSLGYRAVGPLWVEVAVAATEGETAVVCCRPRYRDRAEAVELHDLLTMLVARGVLTAEKTVIARASTVEEPAEIRRQLRALAAYGATGTLLPADGMPWPVQLRECGDGPLPLRLRLAGPAPEPLFQVALVGYNAVFRLAAESGELERGWLSLAMPERIAVVRRRWRRRARAPAGLALAFRHPLWPRTEEVRRLRDVSTNGVGAWIFPEADLLEPGITLRKAAILYHGEVVCEGDAVVRHVSELAASLTDGEGGAALCGLTFAPGSAGDDARLRNLVHLLLNPNTRSGAAWSLQSWRVYTDSGYFHLSGKEPLQFTGLRSSFRQVSRGLDAAPWLGCQAVWPSDRGVEATFTFVKVYSGTWFGYQLAKSPDRMDPGVAPSRQVLRELYMRIFEHMQHDDGLRWVAGYLEASVPWNQIAQFAWAKQRLASGDVCLRDFTLLEGRCEAMTAEPPRGVTVQSASPTTVATLLAHLREHRSRAWCEVLDLTEAEMDMHTIEWLWQGAGLQRKRRIIEARRDDTLLAAAIVETGETGASLFSLLDSVRLWDLRDGAGESCFPALLAAAARGFTTLGKDRFVVYNEDWPQDQALAAGLTDLGHGKLWAVARSLLPDFLESITSLLPPRGDEKLPTLEELT